MNIIKKICLSIICIIFFTNCGGGSSEVNNNAFSAIIMVKVLGLEQGKTLILQNNGGDDLTVDSDGAFTFSTAIEYGSQYNVTVKTQPEGQTCTVENGTGTVGNADVTDIRVVCDINSFHVGGSVEGLLPGDSVVLQNNGGDDLTVDSNGAFIFQNTVAKGATYNVTVLTKPNGQNCRVENGLGKVTNSDITNIKVYCYQEEITVIPDVLFGSIGKSIYDGSSRDDQANDFKIDSTGRIIVTGYSSNGKDKDMVLLRYDENGSLDTTFGRNRDGIVKYDGINVDDVGKGIAIDSNNNIFVTGYSSNGKNRIAVLWKYLENGVKDEVFGLGGKVVYDIGRDCESKAIAIYIDNNSNKIKILVTGYVSNGSNKDIIILRYNEDGSLDTTFGSNKNGIVKYDGKNGDDEGRDIEIDSSGRILVAGYSSNGSNKDIIILRYNEDGSLDTTFGSNKDGIVKYDGKNGDDEGRDIEIDSSGRILVAGYSSNGSSNKDIIILRYNENGTPDTSFGNSGVYVYDSSSSNEVANSICIYNSDIFITGYNVNSNRDLIILKLNQYGKLYDGSDPTTSPSFNTNGVVIYDSGNGDDEGRTIQIDSSGKILVAGFSTNSNNNTDITLWRFIDTNQ